MTTISKISNSNLAVKQSVAKVLGVEVDSNWSIRNQIGHLALAHVSYNPDPEVAESLNFMRGVVVDTQAKVVVCRSNGQDRTVVSDSIQEKQDSYVVGEGLKCLKTNTVLYRGVDGVVIRTFYHNGKVYHSNFTKIDVLETKARLTGSRPFSEIYVDGNGPKDSDLYDQTKKYSPWVHVFVVSDPEVLNVSKIPLKTSMVVHLGSYAMDWSHNTESSPYDDDQVDWTNRMTEFDFETDFDKINGDKPMKLLPFDLKQTTQFLRDGYYPGNKTANPKLRPGECVIMSVTSEDSIPDIFRVHSSGYEHRTSIKQSQPNLFLRFLVLTDYAKWSLRKKQQIDKFVEMFPKIGSVEGMIVVDEPDKSLTTFDDRLSNIWLNFLAAVPVGKQKQVSGYIEDFKQGQQNTSKWLQNIHLTSGYDSKKHPFVLKRVLNEIRQETRFSKRDQKKLKSVVWNKVRFMSGAHLNQCIKTIKRGFFKKE